MTNVTYYHSFSNGNRFLTFNQYTMQTNQLSFALMAQNKTDFYISMASDSCVLKEYKTISDDSDKASTLFEPIIESSDSTFCYLEAVAQSDYILYNNEGALGLGKKDEVADSGKFAVEQGSNPDQYSFKLEGTDSYIYYDATDLSLKVGTSEENKTFTRTPIYYCPIPFQELYHTYTGLHGQNAPLTIGNALLKVAQKNSTGISGPFIIINNTHLLIYNDEGKLQKSADYRDNWSNGFYEMTSVSHVGPAIMSLNYMQQKGDFANVKTLITQLLNCLKEVKGLNAISLTAGEGHWLNRLNLATYEPWKAEIRKMVNYACDTGISYINSIMDEINAENRNAISNTLKDGFLKKDGLGYENVMVSTFMLAALESAVKVYGDALSSLSASDWEEARVIIQTFPGEVMYLNEKGRPCKKGDEGATRYNYGNLTAGLTTFSNWFIPMLKTVSNNKLPDNHIFIPGYAPVLDLGGVPRDLTALELSYYKSTVWNGLYFRSETAIEAMEAFYTFPEDYGVFKRGMNDDGTEVVNGGLWPGDYGFKSEKDGTTIVEQIMQRCYYSFSHVTELLSNSVGFWIVPEFASKNYKISTELTIPGLTGIDYPEV